LAVGSRFQIDIANPCSGLHSLLPLLMFSACFSYAFLWRRWQQWTVFLSAIPLVIIGNVFRILMLVAGCLWWGADFAVGTSDIPSLYHEGCGYAVFVIVLGVECLIGFLLIRHSQADTVKAKEPLATSHNAGTLGSTGIVPIWRSGTIMGFAVLLLIASAITPSTYLPPEAGVLMALPTRVTVPELDDTKFFGFTAPVSQAELTILPKDTEFSRKNYDDFRGHNIFFSIVLSGKQQYTIHPPQVCLVAQGWTINKEDDVPIQLSSGRQLVVRNLSIQRDRVDAENQHHPVHAYYMYWYVADGVTTPSHIERNLLSSWDRIVHNRDHRWAYVIAMSPITKADRPDGLDEGQTREMLVDFIRQIVPSVQKSEAPAGQQLGGL
jgi:EpsI family protein